MIIGKISSYPAMKPIITTSAHIVSFFNGSHYWGGQLEILAKSQGISHGLKTNMELQWYAMILQCLSLQDHQYVHIL